MPPATRILRSNKGADALTSPFCLQEDWRSDQHPRPIANLVLQKYVCSICVNLPPPRLREPCAKGRFHFPVRKQISALGGGENLDWPAPFSPFCGWHHH